MPEESNEIKPAKRPYNRKPAPPPPPAPPATPSPAVIALENEIVKLVGERLAANSEIANAMQAANEANSRLQVAQTRLQQIEREVQYRIALTQQMKGGTPTQIIGVSLAGQDYPPYQNDTIQIGVPQGVGSIPAQPPQPRIVPSGPRIRTESAEGERYAEIAARAAI